MEWELKSPPWLLPQQTLQRKRHLGIDNWSVLKLQLLGRIGVFIFRGENWSQACAHGKAETGIEKQRVLPLHCNILDIFNLSKQLILSSFGKAHYVNAQTRRLLQPPQRHNKLKTRRKHNRISSRAVSRTTIGTFKRTIWTPLLFYYLLSIKRSVGFFSPHLFHPVLLQTAEFLLSLGV